MGRPEENLSRAACLIKEEPSVISLRLSSVWQTEPVGLKDQNWFANQAGECLLAPDTDPHDFLHTLLDIENRMGRVRVERWGPRIIDIDLLLFDDQSMITSDLTLPHPEMTRRAFVLVPLLELGPEFGYAGRGEVGKIFGRAYLSP